MRYSILLILIVSSFYVNAQKQAGKLGLEIKKLQLELNAGPYRGRTAETDGPFNQGVSFIGQVYFPFQLAADYRKNFTDSTDIKDEYNDRVFLIRPSALFHYVDKGSMAFGLGVQFSFLLTKNFYIEYQITPAYVEANKAGEPDLYDGFNLHHIVSLSKPISRHFSLKLAIVHLSGAGLSSGKSANQDVITLGVKWNL